MTTSMFIPTRSSSTPSAMPSILRTGMRRKMNSSTMKSSKQQSKQQPQQRQSQHRFLKTQIVRQDSSTSVTTATTALTATSHSTGPVTVSVEEAPLSMPLTATAVPKTATTNNGAKDKPQLERSVRFHAERERWSTGCVSTKSPTLRCRRRPASFSTPMSSPNMIEQYQEHDVILSQFVDTLLRKNKSQQEASDSDDDSTTTVGSADSENDNSNNDVEYHWHPRIREVLRQEGGVDLQRPSTATEDAAEDDVMFRDPRTDEEVVVGTVLEKLGNLRQQQERSDQQQRSLHPVRRSSFTSNNQQLRPILKSRTVSFCGNARSLPSLLAPKGQGLDDSQGSQEEVLLPPPLVSYASTLPPHQRKAKKTVIVPAKEIDGHESFVKQLTGGSSATTFTTVSSRSSKSKSRSIIDQLRKVKREKEAFLKSQKAKAKKMSNGDGSDSDSSSCCSSSSNSSTSSSIVIPMRYKHDANRQRLKSSLARLVKEETNPKQGKKLLVR